MTTDTKRPFNTAHTRSLLVGFQNDRFLLLGIHCFWIQHMARTAVFASVLLIAERILAVFNDLLTVATSAMASVRLNDHGYPLL